MSRLISPAAEEEAIAFFKHCCFLQQQGESSQVSRFISEMVSRRLADTGLSCAHIGSFTVVNGIFKIYPPLDFFQGTEACRQAILADLEAATNLSDKAIQDWIAIHPYFENLDDLTPVQKDNTVLFKGVGKGIVRRHKLFFVAVALLNERHPRQIWDRIKADQEQYYRPQGSSFYFTDDQGMNLPHLHVVHNGYSGSTIIAFTTNETAGLFVSRFNRMKFIYNRIRNRSKE